MKCLKSNEIESDDYLSCCGDSIFPDVCERRSDCIKTYVIEKLNDPTYGDILDFIHRRFPNDSNWVSGNCYYFSLILKSRFSSGEIYYNPIENHFVFKYGELYFDHTGMVFDDSLKLVKWKDYSSLDESDYYRIIKDCIL